MKGTISSPPRPLHSLVPAMLQHLVLFVCLSMHWYYPDAVVRAQRPTRQCQTIEVPICKGLVSYNVTKLPNRFGHRTQTEVYWAMQPWWPFIDAGCSNNLRTFLCGLYLPRCSGGDDKVPAHYPCSETCRKAKVRCAKQMRRQGLRWSPRFKCSGLLPKSSKRCIRPQRERKKHKNKRYVLCDYNKLSMCRGIPFTQGSLPNMFLQSDLVEIEREMQQFKFLVDSGCSKKLRFFMCGAYMPFCVPGVDEEASHRRGKEANNNHDDFLVTRQQPNVPFAVPCRELCQEVYDQCSGEYQQRTNGLPWPGKFHCHRYPSYIDRYANKDDEDDANSIGNSSRGGGHRRRGTTVSCAMPPYNYDGN